MKLREALLHISITMLMTIVSKSFRFAVIQPIHHSKQLIQQTSNKIIESSHNSNPTVQKTFQSSFRGTEDDSKQYNQLRSYKPHFKHSYSYPSPITPHFLYGQVYNNQPRFLLKSTINATQCVFEDNLIKVNQNLDTSTYEIADQIKEKKYTQKIFQYMLSFQLEVQPAYKSTNQAKNNKFFNLVSQKFGLALNHQEHSIFMQKGQHFYSVVCQYYHVQTGKKPKKTVKSYLLYFTYDTQKSKAKRILSLQEVNNLGLQYRIRNQSANTPKQAWNFPNKLMWRGVQQNIQFNKINQQNVQYSKFKGLVIQFQFKGLQIIQNAAINIKQIHLNDNYNSIAEVMKQLSQTSFDNPQVLSLNSQNKQKTKPTCRQDAINKIKAGLSYQYGTLEIVNNSQKIENQPRELLSFSPSRTRFPWGFLWDDGFHCQVAARSESFLAIKVIKSWLDTMITFNVHQTQVGWIPRQQNRGAQRQFLCSCPRFMKKDIRDGNPPTLMLSINFLLKNKAQQFKSQFSVEYWEKLKKWYNWFIQTQKQQQKFIFSWHDSIQNNGSFNSGMDDFPRMINTKGHVDLQAWMYFFSDVMEKLYELYQEEIGNPYALNKRLILESFLLEFVDNDNIPKDFCILNGNKTFSSFLGYPSLISLSFGMLEYNSKAYNATIIFLKQKMDTGFGIASISMDSPFYLQNQNAYWRGPVWMNINYLILRGLYLYYPKEKQLYTKLRTDILGTVCGNWQRTGYFFQNYIQGKGSFSFPFNGWTSLIAIIQSQEY